MRHITRAIVLGIGISMAAAPLSGLAAAATSASAPALPRLVQEAAAELVALGCEILPLEDGQRLAAARALGWQAVVPRDASGAALVFCPPAVAASLQTYQPGRVAAATAEAVELFDLWPEEWTPYTWEGFKHAASNRVQKIIPVWKTFKKINDAAVTVFWLFFAIFARIASWLIALFAAFIPPLLSLQSFVTNQAVRQAWPIILGVVNLGFLLALVFIALLTVLRLDIGGGVRRLLPRLLLAALLVNFSLVIAGLILDISRLIMALLPPLFNISFSHLQTVIVREADAAIVFLALSKAFSALDWEHVVAVFLSAAVGWVMALALMVVVVGLLMRYIMLILLLIVSPFAYLFLALPSAENLAKRWWTTFMRYVIYGPVVLFIILAAINVKTLVDTGNYFDPADKQQAAYQAILGAALYSGAMVAAAMAGRYAGILGAATAIGFAMRTGQRVRGLAYRGTRGIARTGTAPIRLVGREVKGSALQYAGGMYQGVKDRLGVSRWRARGLQQAERLVGRRHSPADQAAARTAGAAMRAGGGVTAANIADPAFRSYNLRREAVGEEMQRHARGFDNVRTVFQSGDLSQIKQLARNRIMGTISDAQRLQIIADVEMNPHVTALSSNDQSKLIVEVEDSVDKTQKQRNEPQP